MAATGRKLRREPEVLAATRRDSGPEAKGFAAERSALVVLALFFEGPSSASMASSYPDRLPSAGFFRGLPRGLPVGGLRRGPRLEAWLEGREGASEPAVMDTASGSRELGAGGA